MWTQVSSSNIASAAHKDNQLFLRFHNGSVYLYDNVPETVFKDLVQADSVGKFFHATIKPNYQHIALKNDPFTFEDVVH